MRTYKTWKRAPKAVRERVLEKNRDLNTLHEEWWECVYEDARRIQLEIDSFDCYRNEITGSFLGSPIDTVELILNEHGEDCDTYRLAKEYQELFTADCLARHCLGEDDWEEAGEELEKEFKYKLLKLYLKSLDEQYEYMVSDEAIIDTIELNEWKFDETGEILW